MKMAKTSLCSLIGFAAIGVVCVFQTQPAASQEKQILAQSPNSRPSAKEKRGVIPHAPLLKSVLPNTANQEVAVYETEYAPEGINPRHLHPAAITFYVLSGAGVWQEEGKPPITLKAGDSLFVPAGTIHSHWNASTTEPLRFLEFMVAEKDKGRAIPQPVKD
jgi:quercetin dioxygenase-like cupin family protein